MFKNKSDVTRKCDDTITADSEIIRERGFFRNIIDNLKATDEYYFPVFLIRSVFETKTITDTINQCKEYFRGLYDEAGMISEMTRQGQFYRKESDTVQAEGSVFRHLLIFVKIMTVSVVRDFVLRRFLIAREELVLKSCITRDLILESKIN
jgi:hypothetical protein